jgi:DNA-binding transcriptional MerR regulator
MKSNELVKLLNIPESTLRKYAQDYAEYLSPSTANRHREYTEHDARVLKLIVDMKTERVKSQDIEVTLSSLKSGDWRQLPALDEVSKSIIPTQANQVAALEEMSALKREVEVWRELYEKATSDRDELLKSLSEAETLVRLYEQGRLKPNQE